MDRLGILTATVVVLLAAGAGAQVPVLPSVMPASEAFPGRMVSQPDSAAELPQPPPERSPWPLDSTPWPWDLRPSSPDLLFAPPRRPTGGYLPPPQSIPPVNPDRPPDARDGMFQKLIATSSYLDGGGTRGLGITRVDLRSVLAVPLPSRDHPMLITPGFDVWFFQWPDVPDLPGEVYDAYAQFRWFYRFNPALAMDLAITPGVSSDFQQSTDEAFRFPAHGAALWTWTPTVKALLGCAYLDRVDYQVLPIAGIIWEPHEALKVEAVFPKPKISRRIYWPGAADEKTQDWVYLAGEFGGSAWAIRRAGGGNDILDYSDWRILAGIERKAIGRLDYKLELGYLFDRRLKYASNNLEVEPTDTFMLRAGVTY